MSASNRGSDLFPCPFCAPDELCALCLFSREASKPTSMPLKSLTPQEAKEAGYDGWCAHLSHMVCIKEKGQYCATCDPWTLRMLVKST